ncbi:MAG: sulfatase-like hydrolase/transferase [Planctomycetaceae bacterium]|nr:sulfatase-like hydrolase/transferase [Planctomycetaceae bacterium]
MLRPLAPFFSLFTILLCSMFSATSNGADRPNILLIYTDDHSHRTIGCYPEAYDWVKTPNIDHLAKNGVRFASAYIGTWCMPSRAALLTGHHPYGVQSMRMEGEYPGSEYDPEKCPFWPSVFRKQGYTTAQIGKWHTGTDTGFGRDWDYQKVWNRPRYPDNAGNYFYDQLIETNGGEPVMTPGYTTDNYTNWAEEFLRGEHRDAEKPWYLWLCYGAVHGPFTPADRHMDAYPEIEVPVPSDIYPTRPGKPEYAAKMNRWVLDPDGSGQPVLAGGRIDMDTIRGTTGVHGNTLHDWVRQYHQSVLAIDDGVGRLMKTLKETGQLENTVVVFTSDQGFAWGQHGFHHKLAPYDATIRSPLIVSWPKKFPTGAVCPSPVSGVDLVPTFFDLAGIELPWKMHGHSLMPLLTDPSAKWGHPVLTTLTARKYGDDTADIPTERESLYLGGIPWWISLRQGKYKYIRTLIQDEIEELYDLEADPEELNNLAMNRSHHGTVKEFREALLAELRRTGAKMVDHLPPVRPLSN